VNSLHQFAQETIQKALDIGAIQAQVLANQTRIGMARFNNKAIHQNVDGERPTGTPPIGIRVMVINKAGRLGSASSTGPKEMAKCVKDALRCSQHGPELHSFPEPKKATPLSGLYFEDTAELSAEERAECINRVVDAARGVDGRVSFVGGLLSNIASETAIANSLGLNVEHAYTGGHLIVTAVGKEGVREGSGYARRSSRNFYSLDLEGAAKDAACDSISTIGYQNNLVPAGRREVILKPEAAAEYLGTITQQALSVARLSRTADKVPLDKQVFSEELTVVDNGRDTRTLLASAVDGEGTPKRFLSLVNHGVPENRCYDHASAKRERRESTGHAPPPWGEFFFTGTGSGQTYLPTNQIVEPGDSTLDEMIADTKDGVLVTRLRCPGSNGHTILPDTIRADTQECWRIRNGKIAGPANYIRFTDSLVRTLKDIVLGDKSTVKAVGSFLIPAIKLNSLYISQPSLVMRQ